MVDGLTSWGLVLGVVVGIIGCKMTEVWLARVDCVGGRGGGEMSHGGDSRMIVDVFSDLDKMCEFGECVVEGVDFEDMLFDLAGRDPRRAMDLLLAETGNCSPEERLTLYGYFASGMAVRDPLGVLEWANEIENGRISSHCKMSAFCVWLQDEGADPYDLLKELVPYRATSWGTEFVASAVKMAAADDEQRALEWITDNLSGQEKIYHWSLNSVLRAVGKRDSQRMFELANEYELKDGVESALGQVIFGIASEEVSAALRALEDWPGSEEAKKNITGSVLEGFVDRDPDAVMRFMENEYPSEMNEMISNRVTGWIDGDAYGFLDWVGGQNEALKAEILSNPRALSSLGQALPQQAAELVRHTIRNEEDLQSSLRPLVGAWGRNNPAEAVRWLEGQPVSLQSALVKDLVEGARQAAPDSIDAYIESSAMDGEAKKVALENNGRLQ